MIRNILVVIQTLTFIGLGVLLIVQKEYRLGIAQLLLAGVQAAIYTG